jgi:hypothetical protein
LRFTDESFPPELVCAPAAPPGLQDGGQRRRLWFSNGHAPSDVERFAFERPSVMARNIGEGQGLIDKDISPAEHSLGGVIWREH